MLKGYEVLVGLPLAWFIGRDLVFVRSVLFFGGFSSIGVYRENLAWLPDRQPWGNPVICINPKCPLLRWWNITFYPINLQSHVICVFHTFLTWEIDIWGQFYVLASNLGIINHFLNRKTFVLMLLHQIIIYKLNKWKTKQNLKTPVNQSLSAQSGI